MSKVSEIERERPALGDAFKVEYVVDGQVFKGILDLCELDEFIKKSITLVKDDDDFFDYAKQRLIDTFPKEKDASLVLDLLRIIEAYKYFYGSMEINYPMHLDKK